MYYVGDWIDEYCNLTIDVLMDSLGEKINELNSESVKTYISIGERNNKREKLLLETKKKTKKKNGNNK